KRDLASKAVNRAAADHTRVVERARKKGLPVFLAARHSRKPELAFPLAGRRVDSEDRQIVFDDRGFHCCGRHVIGKLQFDSLEPTGAGRINASKKRGWGEEISKFGGNLRHALPQ